MEFQEIITSLIEKTGILFGGITGGITLSRFIEIKSINEFIDFFKLGFKLRNFKEALQISRKKRKERGNNITFENDNFARETIKYRFKDIISSLNAEIDLHPELKDKKINYSDILLHKTKDTIDPACGDLKLSDNDQAQIEKWTNNLNYDSIGSFFYKGPFIDVEHYFYFAILDHIKKTGLDKELKWNDPYASKKELSITKDYTNDNTRLAKGKIYNSKIKITLNLGYQILQKEKNLKALLKANLSSNSTDLSQMFWSEFRDVKAVTNDSQNFEDYTDNIIKKNTTLENTNILVDNYGHEFLCDLILGIYLINFNISQKVTYHVNKLPIFVSDIIEKDFNKIITQLKALCENKTAEEKKEFEVINKIEELYKEGRIIIKPNFFWNMPTTYSSLFKKDAPEYHKELQKIFTGGESQKELLIIKGDLNYRRTVGDIIISPSEKINKYIKYISCPTLIIRSFKSNVVLLGKDNKEDIFKTNFDYDYGGIDWKTEGRAGIIQFVNKNNTLRFRLHQKIQHICNKFSLNKNQ